MYYNNIQTFRKLISHGSTFPKLVHKVFLGSFRKFVCNVQKIYIYIRHRTVHVESDFLLYFSSQTLGSIIILSMSLYIDFVSS